MSLQDLHVCCVVLFSSPTQSHVYAVQTGVKVTNVNDLQDIDELCVVEVRGQEGLQARAAAAFAQGLHVVNLSGHHYFAA